MSKFSDLQASYDKAKCDRERFLLSMGSFISRLSQAFPDYSFSMSRPVAIFGSDQINGDMHRDPLWIKRRVSGEKKHALLLDIDLNFLLDQKLVTSSEFMYIHLSTSSGDRETILSHFFEASEIAISSVFHDQITMSEFGNLIKVVNA